MENNYNFNSNLEEGRKMESAVRERLAGLLPGYDIDITDQGNSIDRFVYSLVDVVVRKGGMTVLGIECKLSETKYEACLNRNGWDGDYNTPLNNTSLREYKEADFPFYVVNINRFCHRAFAADIPTILASPNDSGMNTKRSGVVIYNIDSRNWMSWGPERFTLTDILTDIIKKEGLC